MGWEEWESSEKLLNFMAKFENDRSFESNSLNFHLTKMRLHQIGETPTFIH